MQQALLTCNPLTLLGFWLWERRAKGIEASPHANSISFLSNVKTVDLTIDLLAVFNQLLFKYETVEKRRPSFIQ
jgi:hypothetical protein